MGTLWRINSTETLVADAIELVIGGVDGGELGRFGTLGGDECNGKSRAGRWACGDRAPI